MTGVGDRTWPIDWRERSVGAAPYTGDIVPPDALFGAILRSPHAYALVQGIDGSAALRMPGVRAVITAADFPTGARYAIENTFDRPPLAEGAVRFVGQEIAAVAADTKAQAQAAVAAIEVTYRRLPASLAIDDALAPGAPRLHAEAQPKEGNAAAQPPTPNVRNKFRRLWGQMDKGRDPATVFATGRFWFPPQAHCCMETHRTLAEWKAGRLHLWASTATPLILKQQLALVLALDESEIVIHEVAVGGSFGAKTFITDHEAIAAILARKSARPVYIALTRDEEFETTRCRHGFDVALTIAADSTGKLRSIEGHIRVDSGAYLHTGASVMAASIGPLSRLYDADGLDIDARLVDTAKLPAGAFRGYGAPQTCLALESLIDELAEKLGSDPIDFRIKNLYPPHAETLGGLVGTSGALACLEAVRDAIGWNSWKAYRKPGMGIGVAAGEHISGAYTRAGANRSDGAIDLHSDGRVYVRSGCSDAGTGQRTILAQIAAEELGVPLDHISVHSMDTDETPWDLGAFSSRGTHYTGHAIRLTAHEFADRLKQLAAQRLGPGEVRLEGGFARGTSGEMPLGALVALSNESVQGVLTHTASYVDPNVVLYARMTATNNYSAQAASVHVDEKTGKVTILDYVAAVDAGTAINPSMVEGQVSGAVVMGLGAALGEELIFHEGKLVNPAFLHYPVPRAADVPRIRTLLRGVSDPNGPYGAKGVGEVGISPPGPCVANAVYDAVGLRIRSLPITPDKIIDGLAAKAGRRRRFRLWRRPGRWYIALVRWAYPRGLFKLLHERQMRCAKTSPPAPPLQSVATPSSLDDLAQALGGGGSIIGGGTDLQLRRQQALVAPRRLVSVAAVREMQVIAEAEDGSFIIGGGVTLALLADAVRGRLPALAEAIDEIATPQIRNVATVAGNLLQDKRCWFYRNGFNCYKRMNQATLAPCYAITGDHRFYHAAIGGGRCQAVTPSDLATVLSALDAKVTVVGPGGMHEIPIETLYNGPGETVLGERDILTSVTIPADAVRRRTSFKKLNLWQGDFAVASVALSVLLDEAGCSTELHIVLGAVAPVPIRASATETMLLGKPLTPEILRVHLDRELNSRAHPLTRNGWKLDAVAGLTERAVAVILATGERD